MTPRGTRNRLSRAVVLGLILPSCSSMYMDLFTFTTLTEQDARPVPFHKIVVFDKAVHGLSPEGKDVVIAPGEHRIEGGEKTVRLQPADNEETEAIVIQAETVSQDRPAPIDSVKQMAQSCPDEGAFTLAQAQSQDVSSGEVQERAVPANMEGVIVQGNQLRAAQDYVLEAENPVIQK